VSEPRFFRSQKEFRAWLEKNHATKSEIVVGFEKGAKAKGGLHRAEAVGEALCFGWIDGIARGGATTWSIRFTPRKAKSIWSDINIRRIAELKAAGRVHAAGWAAFENRDPALQKRYSFENPDAQLSPAQLKQFKANRAAWTNFEAMPKSYRHPAVWWVVSARQEATRQRRLATLISDSEAGIRLKHLRPLKAKATPA